ncbi:MAG: hypothetical protein K1X79_00155 [Oligoflexia bacterium]|nr:hypothetical protein [Oligoflexia bacterium]
MLAGEKQSKNSAAGRLIFALSFTVMLITPMLLRTYVEGHQHLEEARAAALNKEIGRAVDEYSLALAWSTPFDGIAQAAFSEARSLIKDQVKGQQAQAHSLWQLRRGLFTSRNILTPRAAEDALIAEIDSELSELGFISPTLVAQSNQPKANFGWQLLSQLLFWCWIVSVFSIIWRAFSAAGTFNKSKGARFGVLSLILYAAWLVSLLRA